MEKLKLKAIRANRELTIKEVSDETGISERSISRWETGKQSPRLSSLKRLLEFYEVDLEMVDI